MYVMRAETKARFDEICKDYPIPHAPTKLIKRATFIGAKCLICGGRERLYDEAPCVLCKNLPAAFKAKRRAELEARSKRLRSGSDLSDIRYYRICLGGDS